MCKHKLWASKLKTSKSTLTKFKNNFKCYLKSFLPLCCQWSGTVPGGRRVRAGRGRTGPPPPPPAAAPPGVDWPPPAVGSLTG